MRILAAGLVYFATVFALGFALGTLRVMVLIPGFGESAAVALELPVMLAASWLLCRWCLRGFAVPPRLDDRALMGAVAFGLLMLAELALGMLLFGRTLGEHLATYRTFAGAAGLAAQLLFAAFPVLQLSGDRRHGRVGAGA